MQTPERHRILAAAAARMAELLEWGARNHRFDEFERARYAALARTERRAREYHEEAAQLLEQGRPVPEWFDWLLARDAASERE
jgi:hypothetical protein